MASKTLLAVAAAGGVAFVAPGSKGASAPPALRGQGPSVRSQTSSGLSSAVTAVALSSAVLVGARKNNHTALRAFETELGVTPPLGFWDPLGFSKFENPEVAQQQFKRRRIVEIQHGRVAMLACLGYIVPEYFRFPGLCSPSQGLAFTDIPNGLKGAAAVPLAGWLQIITFVGIIEVTNLQKAQDEILGDYGYGAFGLPFGKKIDDPEKKKKSLTAELNNGRLAMMAIIGMFYQDGLTGSAWGDWANYADSPLRAFEEELGVQAPVGFWDPVGYTRDGNMETFKRRRETEIKHGRVAMYATMGYIVPEYFKWPGYLSPSLGLKFDDVPNGLAAISKVPGNGWAQIVVLRPHYFGFSIFRVVLNSQLTLETETAATLKKRSMAESPQETESVEGTNNANSSTSSSESEFSAVIFNNVPECYPPDRDIECRFKIKSSVKPSSRDWIGLFKVGWQSSREHYTYEWSPMPDIQNGEQGRPVANRVVFRERYLPKADDEFYQFCYVTYVGDVRGASVPFQIKTKPFEQDDLECCEIEDDEGSSIMIVKNKTAILEESLGRALEENETLKSSKETAEADLANANEEIMRLGTQKVELTTALKETKKKSAKLEETLAQKSLIMESEQSKIEDLEKKVSDLNAIKEISEGKIKELMMILEQEKAQTTEFEKNKEKLVIERNQYLDSMIADRQMIEKVQNELKAKEEEHNLLKARFIEFKTKVKTESVEFQEKLEKANSANARLQEQLTQITAENSMLKRNMEEESDRLTKKIRDVHQELKSKDQELSDIQKELVNSSHKVADLEKSKEEILNDASHEAELLGNKIDKLQAELKEKQQLIHQFEHELEDCKIQLGHEKGKTTALEEDYESVIRALQDQLDGEKALNQSLCSQSDRNLADLQGQVQKQLEANMELTVQLEGRNAEIRVLVTELDECKRLLHAEEEKVQKAWFQITAADAELQSLRVDKESLQATLEDAQGASARSSKNSAASMYALQTAHGHLEKKYLKAKKELEELWRERNDLKKSLAVFQANVPSDDIRLQIEELRANNEDLRVRLNMGAEAYKVKFVECRQLEAKLSKLQRRSSVESLESSSILEMQSMVLKLQKALDGEKNALDIQKQLVLRKNEEVNQLQLKVSDLMEKAERYEYHERQTASHAQSQLLLDDLLGKVASLERNLEMEKKEKEGIIHEMLSLQVDLRSKEDDFNCYAENLREAQEALFNEQREREILGEQARLKLQEHKENEHKLSLRVKELEREVDRWKKEVDLYVEAESKLMESKASSEDTKPQNNPQPTSPAPAMMPVRGIRPSSTQQPCTPPCGAQPWVFVQNPSECMPTVPVQPLPPEIQLLQPSAPVAQPEASQCPVCMALLPPSIDKDNHVNSHFE